jgi:hypothetical protein
MSSKTWFFSGATSPTACQPIMNELSGRAHHNVMKTTNNNPFVVCQLQRRDPNVMENREYEDEMEEAAVEVTQPIIIDLGKQRRKHIKRLKRGRGKLWDEVVDVLEEVSVQLGEEAQDKILVPVVMVYRKKKKKGKRVNLLFPFA